MQREKVLIVSCTNVEFTDLQYLNSFQTYVKLSAKFLLLIIQKYQVVRRNGKRLLIKLIRDGSFPSAMQLLMENTSVSYAHLSGAEFYNYKGFYSIVLLTFVNYNYKFLVTEVGCQGRIRDGGVYRNSSSYLALRENRLNLPDAQPLPQSSDLYWEFYQDNDEIPIAFVGDDTFPLGEHCMKPYGLNNASNMERVFDYRLSKFRRTSQNGFGIWSNRFRLFSTRPLLTPDKAVIAIMASLALHNMLRIKSSESYTPTRFVDFEIPNGYVIQGEWCEC